MALKYKNVCSIFPKLMHGLACKYGAVLAVRVGYLRADVRKRRLLRLSANSEPYLIYHACSSLDCPIWQDCRHLIFISFLPPSSLAELPLPSLYHHDPPHHEVYHGVGAAEGDLSVHSGASPRPRVEGVSQKHHSRWSVYAGRREYCCQ